MNDLLKNHSDLPLVFGGASISGEGGGYGFGDISEQDSLSLLKESYEKGIRVYDTAPIYGFRESEKRIGKAFHTSGLREKVTIVSKSGVSWHSTMRVNMTNDPDETRKMLECSLRDLQSEYIDLYMVHWPDKRVDIRTTMEVLSKAKSEGKIKSIGLCNTNPEELAKASEVDLIDTIQGQLNFFERAELENIFPVLNGRSFMSWGSFDKGILTGRVKQGRIFDKSDCRSWAPWWKKDKGLSSKIQKVEKIDSILKDTGYDLIEFALSYNLSFKNVFPICGMRNSSQLNSTLNGLNNLIPQETFNSIMQRLSES